MDTLIAYTNGKWRYNYGPDKNWKTITKKQFKTAIKGIEKGKKMTIKIPF